MLEGTGHQKPIVYNLSKLFMISKIYSLLSARQKFYANGLILIALISAIFESVSIIILLPFLDVLIDVNSLKNYFFYNYFELYI